jgi:hypothetical protein
MMLTKLAHSNKIVTYETIEQNSNTSYNHLIIASHSDNV